ncbi:calcineurin-like phosphoesterase C-terminal domain-containing protein [Streptomyces marincola]|uniref:calcineurin-like phosphoesterase C-terminal domain-containing protein n=1 Tax=Streptomyces marincola TaxID=2878388 RepID=UPI001CF4981B|nr:calcineurin-like phosphoesterase family protein [Streptomyces marincola]UCM91452.1 calcineurin-like phosphoesterase family protein [Streptomyces marincola]
MVSFPAREHSSLRIALTALTTLAVAGGLVAIPTASTATPGPAPASWDENAYRGQVEVVRTPEGPADPEHLTGRVFVDRDRDSVGDRGERGLPGVVVSNGRDVVTTDRHGRYRLPVYDNMTVFITQPSGYQVPVDESNVAQFHWNHLPEGSPELRYGGIAPTGPLPDAVNFPLVRSQLTRAQEQHCVIAGDLQTYDRTEVEYARRGAINDLAGRRDYQGCGTLFIGDVVGDDLSLYPDVKELTSRINGPARFLPGNHDLDFDSTTAEHAFDTFRAQLAPAYYSYDVGDVHVVALNTVRYPCTPDVDNADGLRPQCDDPENSPRYNGRLDEHQLAWLERDLAAVDEDKLVVLAGHIPLLTFADEGSPIHQVDQVREIYALLEGREAVSVAGHTHSIENMRTGDLMRGWQDLFGVEGLPFPHITAGAISGDWYSGELTEHGYPAAVGRDGGRPGLLTLDIRGDSFRERYTVTGESDRVQTQLGINSPTYRDWYAERQAWNDDPQGPAPELGDPHVVTRADLAGQTWLTTNFWMGSTGSTVEVRIDGGRSREAVRTQPMRGEDQLIGPEWSDPHAVAQQLVHGGSVADRTMHLWRLELPADLDAGRHRAEVTATDVHGREYTDVLHFRVVEQP